MKRDGSTSTIGQEESRKPLVAAYIFQRRMLLGCSVFMIFAFIIWIVAIATDHWIIISGNGGIFIPETRRFFMSSHSGLWRHCRYSISPNAQPNANIVRNFTSIAYQNPALLNEAKLNASKLAFVQEFLKAEVNLTDKSFTEEAKRRMFVHWLRGDETEFQMFRSVFQNVVVNSSEALADLNPIDAKAISINPLDVGGAKSRDTFGKALQDIKINDNVYHFVVPEVAQLAYFSTWNESTVWQAVAKLFWPYARDLGIPPYVLNDKHVVLQLVPPPPPKRAKEANGYDYVQNTRCKYIDMFPNQNALRSDPGFDDELMDYIRTQASFACITVFVMCLGAVFSFYTFMNPRYMFKRLAGGIHLVSASCAIVVIQVLISSVAYTREHLFYAYPDGAELIYGYGVYLAWFTFAVNLVSGLMFMWYSGKKKGSKAATEELGMADEPTIMGR